LTRERQLEDLLFSHPYLIDPEFDGLAPRRQVAGGRHRLDLVFETPGGICLVELKKTPLTLSDLEQLARYCRSWPRQDRSALAAHHYLVGQRPANEDPLRRAATRGEFDIRLRFLGEHVPLRLMWDAEARRYRPFDDDRAAADYLELKL